MQRHPFNKRIQRAGGDRIEPLLQRVLAHLHPVLHHRFKGRAAVHKSVQLVHQCHVVRRGHLRAVDQRGDGLTRHFRPCDARKEIPVLLRHLPGKPRKGLFQQRFHTVKIVGHRPQRYARAGGDFTVRDGVNTVLSDGVQRRLEYFSRRCGSLGGLLINSSSGLCTNVHKLASVVAIVVLLVLPQ